MPSLRNKIIYQAQYNAFIFWKCQHKYYTLLILKERNRLRLPVKLYSLQPFQNVMQTLLNSRNTLKNVHILLPNVLDATHFCHIPQNAEHESVEGKYQTERNCKRVWLCKCMWMEIKGKLALCQ